MEAHYATVDQPATPEYILAVLQDVHRQQCQFDVTVNPSAVLSMETTVAEWRDACDLLGWKQLGRALNEDWRVTITDAEWRAVLNPAGEKRLADVCELIASRATRPSIRPARLLGGNCVPAGAFLTIRSLLHEAGEQAAGDIAPSTPLAPYARRHAAVFLGPVSRLAPGSLPLVRIRTPVCDAAVWNLLVAAVFVIVGLASGILWLAAAGLVRLACSGALIEYAARCLLPSSVEFGELQTFRDLAVVIAEGRPPN